jgi:ankyrin repeat protein
MFRAIRSGDVDEVLRLLEADPTLRDEQGEGYGSYPGDTMPSIVLAASVGKLDMVKLLVGRGANIHTTSSRSCKTALHFAATEGHEEMVVYLLDNGADPMRLDKVGWTPLMYASVRGHLGVVLLLLEPMGGQGLETRGILGNTALGLAIRWCHENVVAELLRHGAQAYRINEMRHGNSTLGYTVNRGHVGMVKVLVDHMGTQALHEWHSGGRGLLHIAAQWAKEDMVAYLVGKGLRPSITDDDGMTPLMYGVWVNPLMYGPKRSDFATVRVLKRLLSHMDTPELDIRDDEGRTALHWAVHGKCPGNVRVLLVAGADASIVDNEGRTPRMRAENFHAPECMAVFEVGTHMGLFIISRTDRKASSLGALLVFGVPRLSMSRPQHAVGALVCMCGNEQRLFECR